jgi:hypothetical protein
MSPRPLANVLSSEEQDVDEVWNWYEFQRALIGEEKSRVLDAFALGASPIASRYFGRTAEELEDVFAYQLLELSRLTMFGLLASTEAALRVDFVDRVKNKRKDKVSRRFREIFGLRREKLRKIRLDEDILDAWKEHRPETKGAVGDFKGTLKLRDWLAHGRYWRPKLGRAAGYDPVDVFEICRALLQVVGLRPMDPTDAQP